MLLALKESVYVISPILLCCPYVKEIILNIVIYNDVSQK